MASRDEKHEKPPGRIEDSSKLTLGVSFKYWLGDWRRWLRILFLFLVLEIAVLSIEWAQWITPQPSLTLVLILAMLTAWLLNRSRIPVGIIHILALVIGASVTIWQATSVASFGQATIYFAIFLSMLTWVIGYISTWYIIRKQNAWVAVSLGAVAVLVNLSNLPDKYFVFFGLYFIAAIVLIVQNRITKLHYLSVNGEEYSCRGLLYLMVPVLCVGIVAVSLAWIIPEVRAPQLETALATKMLWTRNIEGSRLNFFAPVLAKQPKTTSRAREFLYFGSKWHQESQVHFIVSSTHPSYWQVQVYDTYTSGGWTNSPTTRHMLEEDVPWDDTEPVSELNTLTYTVETRIKTDVMLTAGEFISSDTPVLVHVGAGDVIAVTIPRLFKPEDRYTVTSSVSSATPDDLSVVGAEYPQSVRDSYLQLPPDFPESIRELSARITQNAITPYDKIVDINNYLSLIPYEEGVEAPPWGTDGVEHFLFTQKSGYCVYFASAMAVMLRSVDVPSRLVVGYLPGDSDGGTGVYTLRDKHYHTWPQVYFPGYGWVDLEATPIAHNEVAIETPWVSGQSIQESLQPDFWLIWAETYVNQQGILGAGIGEETVQTELTNPRWAFADVVGTVLLWILIVVAVVILLLIPVLFIRSAFYRWLWSVIRVDSASLVYSKLCALGSLAKIGPRPQQTPLEYTAELTSEFPPQAEALNKVMQTYVEKRFGGREGRLGLMEEAELLKSRRDAYNAILKRLNLFNILSHRR